MRQATRPIDFFAGEEVVKGTQLACVDHLAHEGYRVAFLGSNMYYAQNKPILKLERNQGTNTWRLIK